MKQKKSKRGKTSDKRPARVRYWASRTLQQRKVRRIVRSWGYTEAEALTFWLDARQNRRTPYLGKRSLG